MEITTLCTVVASLRISPSRSQFFQYESVSLSCGQQGNSSEWRVKRNTSEQINVDCPTSWNSTNESNCFISDVYWSDSGVYWCESGAGRCSNSISITVTAGSVILESPVLPVVEGEAVTLRCTNRKTSSSNSTTSIKFYKDGLLLRSSTTGTLTIHSVSKSDEGLYRCNISGAGRSPDSWLAVEAGHPDLSQNSSVTLVLLPVVGVCILLASMLLLCLWRSHKGKVDPDVSYTDVIITQEVQPHRNTDVDAQQTVYSTVKPGTT